MKFIMFFRKILGNALLVLFNSVGIYLFKVNNGNSRMCEIYSKLAIKTPERRLHDTTKAELK